MSYKVEYSTLGIMPDGSLGNLNMGCGHIFTDSDIEKIPEVLDNYLRPKNRKGVIRKIEYVGGVCV